MRRLVMVFASLAVAAPIGLGDNPAQVLAFRGARILPVPETHAEVGELLRTLGFAATPGLIQVFGVLPGAKVPVFTVAVVWALAASVVAVRQALDYTSTRRALAVCGLSLLLSLSIAIVLGLLFGPTLSGF